jgi:molybdopterin-binding protein
MMRKISARNQLGGRVVGIHKGQTTAHVKVDLGNGIIVTASITNEAVDDLDLAENDKVVAIIKASDVMIGK